MGSNLTPRREGTKSQPEFLRNAVGINYKTGNVVLDVTTLTVGEEIKAGTAVFYNPTTNLYETVKADTPETMEAACLTRTSVKVLAGQNPMTGALSACHPLENRCTGVTAAFKAATKGRIIFDI